VEKQPLTIRQQEILEYVATFTRDVGYPPTVREIGSATGLRSPRSVSQHLQALERKGFIHRGRDKSRAIRILDRPDSPGAAQAGHVVPLRMRNGVIAGPSSTGAEPVDAAYFVDRALFEGTGNFLMRIEGDLLIDAHILEGDLIVVSPDRDVHSGDVVVARVGGEVSVKRYEKAGATPVEILGKVVGLIRPGT